ncbi:putative galaptin lec-7 [Caenorhabditis elegans]|uniref:Probable galaptin lec-7 n=1 Tax=Caenorhabditis elegans TaxID=6239 RepID=LEC7_CAEEL|nr:putative galaptin lec-7 [Caenorhabditis elegans]Q09605.2 RecName: Full=Probable galaptin lec-7 [Caenorhabditis elegans]CAA88540.2 Probable galaptin lec-7 [Caenorhabditis elegans]|eukprot:NP_509650.3 Probable galaptin lec-7 [Caenorhabditis elegans]
MYVIENPKVPSVYQIEENLKAGVEIEVNGAVLHGNDRDFAIELLSGTNIVLHVKFEFNGEHSIVLNSLINGEWGPQLRHSHFLKRHDPFHVRIYVHEGYYNITVNSDLLVEFDHRFPVVAVQGIGIKGSVDIESIVFKGYEFKTEWKKRHAIVNEAVCEAYDTVTNAPSVVQIEGTQHY